MQELIEVRATAGAQERARLAREIHDGVAQDLAALGYRLDDLATAPGLATDERSEIRQVRIALAETLYRLRRSIFDLRAFDIDLEVELPEFLRNLESAGMQVSFICDPAISHLSAPVVRQLHAIALEALSNVVHHARATRLEVALSNFPDFFQLTIQDNGIGNADVKEFSYGLATMAERAESIGATCTIENAETGGTLVRVSVPRQ
jgi:signal transduction histidine kinase